MLTYRQALIKLFATIFFFVCGHAYAKDIPGKKRIAILTGAKSHGPGDHEYLKSARLIKVMLEHSNINQLQVDLYNDWPENESSLDSAAAIMVISDGRDGDLFTEAPHLLPERIPVIEKQMKRGCGLITFHFANFAPDQYADQVLDWTGGYFDWQDETGKRSWYSSIKTLEAEVQPASVHTVLNGVKPFLLKEEFYYNMRFREDDPGWSAVLRVPMLDSAYKNGKTVAWAVERKNGSRGFATTMGHFYSNWQVAGFRKAILNGIVWAAGIKLPAGGVEAKYYTDKEVTQLLYNRKLKALLLTGDNIEAHEWSVTTPLLKAALEESPEIQVDVSVNIEDLSQYSLEDYDLLLLNYCNWNRPDPLSDASKKAFVQYLDKGGGLMIIHFSNGAFHYSLPQAPGTDWPEYRKICRRVWDHTSNSAHDAFGAFTVKVTSHKHPITKGIKNFVTTDELYYNQKGDEPIIPLLTALSKNTGKEEPLAWTYQYGKGRVFQTLLGHNHQSYQSAAFRMLLKRGAEWAGGLLK
ncbi:MAG: ThuA domain-containing protein [Chitinophagaceae bacterium]|nr:ThuA domain-containing protein [Chitinophagaceae bacterium]